MNKKVLFLVNHDLVIFNFRRELVEELINLEYDVYISSPYGKRIDFLIEIGCKFIETKMNRHGINVFEDLKLFLWYKKIIKKLDPLVVLTYTIKPNIYGGLASKKCEVPYIANITGLGTAVEKRGTLQKITVFMYKHAFSNIHTLFFQNNANRNFFRNRKIAIQKHKLLPGSGVNLDYFHYLPYPEGSTINFAFISRIMKEKGIEYFLEAAETMTLKYSNVVFHVCGFCEQDYHEKLINLHNRNIIVYHGMVDDVRDILAKTHCVIHPSYYPEGMSNVLLESASSGRAIITTNRSGCRETIEDKITGFLIDKNDVSSLELAIEKFLSLDYSEKRELGVRGRVKMEKEFSRKIIIKEYIDSIRSLE